MHEIGLVRNLILALEKEAADPAVEAVKTIYLQVGRLQQLTPEIINHSFEHLPKSKKLAGAKIKVKLVDGNEFLLKKIEW